MKRTGKRSEKTINKKPKKKTGPKQKNPGFEKIEDIKKLVHLLQVHHIELEHQNLELRNAHEELEVSRFKYVNLFDFSPVPYFTLNPNGIIKEVNLSASKMLRIDRNKLIGRSLITYIPLDEKDIFNSFIKTVFNSTEKHSCELEIINKEKRLFHVRLEGLKLDDTLEPDPKCQVALIDLTEYKKIEDSLKETNEALTILNSTKDKFFSIIAHDLRSPCQSLLNYSELLAKEIKSLSQEEIILFSKGLNDILNSINGLLENLLNWSMMQRDMLEYKPVNVNLYNVVNKIIEISGQSAKEKNISISSIIDTRTFVYADVDMLRTVVQNLIINAIKFTNKGGQINVSSVDKDGFVEVSVQDNGIGIDEEKSAGLFNFSTLFSTNGTAGEKGTGLGLPLCKEFVERNEGKIWVESKPGKGSKFTFTLRKMVS
ncbi:MAG: PAS domain-containing protein [Ignavibacteriales bacterium]|nr:MAG: PAS domain-containing protein [Ignavibacteriales bacterium]